VSRRDHAARSARPQGPGLAYSRWHAYPLVSISDDQRKPLASANWLATIHHGLAAGIYSFNEVPSDPYLAFLGRISPEKRPDRAISIAKRLGMRLKIAAKVDAVARPIFATR
jgi:glycosyltransferase involved in cell wall biosynthesis